MQQKNTTLPHTVHNLIFILLLWKDIIYKIYISMITSPLFQAYRACALQSKCLDKTSDSQWRRLEVSAGVIWSSITSAAHLVRVLFHNHSLTATFLQKAPKPPPPRCILFCPSHTYLQPYHIYSNKTKKRSNYKTCLGYGGCWFCLSRWKMKQWSRTRDNNICTKSKTE